MEQESKLEGLLMEWKEREQRYQKLFSPSVLSSREFLKEKLNDYERLQARFVNSENQKDRQALSILRMERRALEKRVYPNIFIRLVRRGIVALLLQKEGRSADQKAMQNQSRIAASMREAGLEKYATQLITKLQNSGKEVSMPISLQVSEKERLDITPQFKKDISGEFQMEGFKASLMDANNKKQAVFIETGSGITADHAVQLLSGRAVHKSDGGWQVLDFNDKDAAGNYRIREVPGHLFDIEKALKDLPVKNGQDGQDMMNVQSALENGQQVAVVLNIKGKDISVSIQADPKRGQVAIYKDSNPVTLSSLQNPTKEIKLQKENRQQLNVSRNVVKGVHL